MVIPGVKAKCKNCGCEALAEQFRLHYQLKMMVCPNCYSGKTQKEQQKKIANVPEVKNRPAGWDADDDYLERVNRSKQRAEPQVVFSKIPGTDQVKYTCVSCKYIFKYDPYKKQPKACPYCNAEIPRLKNFSLC